MVTTAHWTGLERRENVVRDLTVFGWLGQITLHRTQADTCCARLQATGYRLQATADLVRIVY